MSILEILFNSQSSTALYLELQPSASSASSGFASKKPAETMSTLYVDQSSWWISLGRFYRQAYKAFQKITKVISSAYIVSTPKQTNTSVQRNASPCLSGANSRRSQVRLECRWTIGDDSRLICTWHAVTFSPSRSISEFQQSTQDLIRPRE